MSLALCLEELHSTVSKTDIISEDVKSRTRTVAWTNSRRGWVQVFLKCLNLPDDIMYDVSHLVS